MSWSKAEERRLVSLCKKNLFATEIAERMGRDPGTIRYKMRKLGISPAERNRKSGRMGHWNAKHAHLRKRVLKYFMRHSFAETARKFGLTESNLKSLMTVSYRDPELAEFRKDSRRKDVWSFDETMFLLRCSGLQPRSWIAAKLKRGTMQSVKEMVSRLNANTRYMNGLPRKLAEELVGHKIDCGFKVKAGPSAEGVDCRPIIVPWVVIYQECKRSKTVPDHIVDAVRVMAVFQKRIHGVRSSDAVIENICKILQGKQRANF